MMLLESYWMKKLYMQQKKNLENSNTEKYIAHIITKR